LLSRQCDLTVCCSAEQRSGADRLLPSDEPARWIRLAADVRHDHLQRQERRRTEHHRNQLRAQVSGTGEHQAPCLVWPAYLLTEVLTQVIIVPH